MLSKHPWLVDCSRPKAKLCFLEAKMQVVDEMVHEGGRANHATQLSFVDFIEALARMACTKHLLTRKDTVEGNCRALQTPLFNMQQFLFATEHHESVTQLDTQPVFKQSRPLRERFDRLMWVMLDVLDKDGRKKAGKARKRLQ